MRVEDRAFSGSLLKYRLAGAGLRLHAAVPYVNGTPLFEIGDQVTAGWEPLQAVVDGADLPAARVEAERVVWLVDREAAPR